MSIGKRIVECVPNFSEGRNPEIIRQITSEIEKVKGVRLLDVDPGEATNRTVVTFVGEPEAVVEAAFQAVRKAGQVIDMRQHHGAHPRMGATDVLPLIPVSGITLEECAELARALARRIADELRIPCYCYEAAAFTPERRNLAVCREGEYEALPKKLSAPGKGADFGNRPYDEDIARTGCTVVGARDFLIAVNFNLNTTSTRRANAIAFDVREKGRPRREGNPIIGKPMKDAEGHPIMIPGTLKCTKAIGWYIDEYGIAQVSMNITNINVTPLHVAFDEVSRCATNRGIRVTGTEIVGLIPKRTLIEAGKYFLEKQHRSTGIPEADIIDIAIHSLGLSDLKPFNPREKVIEFLLEDERWKEFSDSADEGQQLMEELLHLVDEDTAAFNRIMAAFGMPKSTEEEKALRSAAIQAATLYATEVPLRTMKTASRVFALCRRMAEKGNPNSISDAGVGALAARAAVLGAGLNVKINAASLKDRSKAEALIAEADQLIQAANAAEQEILHIVNKELRS